ncbi:DMT family transporter [Gallaecimonas sp. GXIMD4217]|uniref:DMT family transporter n=1 Tax=Gallaecimonas sp. GXIMD4217 TaxID=3131927 RepID=UPI00311B3F8D
MNNERKALLCGLAAVLMWSTVASAFKLTLALLTPVQMLLVASLTSIGVLGSVAYRRGALPLLGRYLRERPGYFLSLGLINPFLYYLVLFAAYDLLPAQQAQALNYTWAVTLTLLSVPFLGHRIRRLDWLAIGLSYLGVLVIATKGEVLALQFDNPLGVALALLSTLLWACYWILNTRHQGDAVISLLLGFLLGLPAIIAVLWYQGQWQFPWQGVLGAVYIGAFEMGFAFLLWLMAMRLTSNTARISNLIFISPLLSLALLATLVGEAILPSTLVGLCFILASLGVQQLGPKGH